MPKHVLLPEHMCKKWYFSHNSITILSCVPYALKWDQDHAQGRASVEVSIQKRPFCTIGLALHPLHYRLQQGTKINHKHMFWHMDINIRFFSLSCFQNWSQICNRSGTQCVFWFFKKGTTGYLHGVLVGRLIGTYSSGCFSIYLSSFLCQYHHQSDEQHATFVAL